MKTIKPTTELETELLAVVAELTLENRRLKVALEDSEKLHGKAAFKDRDVYKDAKPAFVRGDLNGNVIPNTMLDQQLVGNRSLGKQNENGNIFDAVSHLL